MSIIDLQGQLQLRRVVAGNNVANFWTLEQPQTVTTTKNNSYIYRGDETITLTTDTSTSKTY